MAEKRQSFKHVDSMMDMLRFYNKVERKNAWVERDEDNDLWIIVREM